MLDIKMLRENPDLIRNALDRRGASQALIDEALAADGRRRTLLRETEALKSRLNTVSKDIGKLRKAGVDTAAQQADMRALGDQIAALDDQVRDADAALRQAMLRIPNMPHGSTPEGKDSADNVVARSWGQLREFAFAPKGHVELGEALGLFDFTRATKMTGAGFPLYLGAGARLERALINFMLDIHCREQGYLEMSPPFVVNSASMTGTGQLPKMAEDMYRATSDDLWLIPTAEVPVTNYYRDEVLTEPLPVKLTAYTPCFRREAGAAGRETRGLIRVHQFDKVEMVKFADPATSYAELETLVGDAEAVLQRLKLPYRILSLCAGDISFAAAKCYDIELWAPGQNAWLEVSSCSNFEAFQARRANIRYRKADGKPDFLHTLNGSGVALARLVVAILENYQQADGRVAVPEALVPYMDGVTVIAPRA
jgi:seryl-tRNA synthetase